MRQHGQSEEQLAKDVRKYFRQQERAIQDALKDAGSIVPADVLFKPSEWDEKLKEVVGVHLLRSAHKGAMFEREVFGNRKQLDQEDIDSILIDLPPDVQAAIAQEIETALQQDYWLDINKTTARKLDAAIQDALSAGENLSEMSKRIGQALGVDASSKRAIRTARTETTGALNSGAQAVRQELAAEGLIKGKEWLATLDADTRPEHVAADNQQVSVNEEFNVGGESAPYPGWYGLSAAMRVNCRCTSISNTILD